MFTEYVFNEEIWVCDINEAKRLWNEKKQDRFRIWTLDEYRLAGLLGPEELETILRKKKNPKGFVFKGQSL